MWGISDRQYKQPQKIMTNKGTGHYFKSMVEAKVLSFAVVWQKPFKRLVTDRTCMCLCWHKTDNLLLQGASFKVFRQFGAWCVKSAISILKLDSLAPSLALSLSLTHTQTVQETSTMSLNGLLRLNVPGLLYWNYGYWRYNCKINKKNPKTIKNKQTIPLAKVLEG